MGLFKTARTFGAYIHAQLGSDITGDGSRNNPWATISKGNAASITTYLLSGIFTENFYMLYGRVYEFEPNSKVSGNQLVPNTDPSCEYTKNATIDGNMAGSIELLNTIVRGTVSVGTSKDIRITGCFIYTFSLGKLSSTNLKINNSILNYNNYLYSTDKYLTDSIIISEVNLYNFTSRANTTYYPVFRNCLFRKATLWKWNTTTISINWTNNPVGGAAYTDETLMTRVYNSLLFYANSLGAGTDKTYFLAILATQDTMFKECIVWDDSDTVNNPIFSRYIDGVPVDYTLALKSNNPALYMSTTGSYVGCYAANVNDDGHGNHITFGGVKHVDVGTGLDTATLPDLLVQDPSNPAKFSASQTSLQLWNRIRTSVVEYPRGKSFAGMQSQLDSGIASRLFFGKRQEIRTTGDISQKTTAFESVEVIPYDSLPTPNTGAENTINNMSATLPRFSAPFNGECLLFYRSQQPLLFNQIGDLFQGSGTVSITSGSQTVTGVSTTFTTDFVKDDCILIGGIWYKILSIVSNTSLTLFTAPSVTLATQIYRVGICTDKNLSIYGTWAVTNADIESYSLIQKVTKAGLSTSIPLIKWCKFELNLHYDEE